MRHFYLSIFSSLLLLSSCQNKEIIKNDIHHSYEEVSQYFIYFDDIFNIDIDLYYVYFFSYQCIHCNNIKDQIIDFALDINNDFYFCHFESTFPRCDEYYHSLVGVSSLSDICLVGTPELIKIMDKNIIDFFLGEEEILLEINNRK